MTKTFGPMRGSDPDIPPPYPPPLATPLLRGNHGKGTFYCGKCITNGLVKREGMGLRVLFGLIPNFQLFKGNLLN